MQQFFGFGKGDGLIGEKLLSVMIFLLNGCLQIRFDPQRQLSVIGEAGLNDCLLGQGRIF